LVENAGEKKLMNVSRRLLAVRVLNGFERKVAVLMNFGAENRDRVFLGYSLHHLLYTPQCSSLYLTEKLVEYETNL
jgi:hypothetical protein